MKKGDRLVAYGERRPAERLFVYVTRVARDGSWADLKIGTWACAWSKRMRLPFPKAAELTPRDWGQSDLNEQEADAVAKLREEGKLR